MWTGIAEQKEASVRRHREEGYVQKRVLERAASSTVELLLLIGFVEPGELHSKHSIATIVLRSLCEVITGIALVI